MLVFVPVLDIAMSVWPPQVAEVGWRFGAAGLFSRAVLLPLLGLLLLFAVALDARRAGFLSALAWLAAGGCLVLVGVTALFTLDGLQMRAQVVEELKVGWLVNMAGALLKYLIGAVGLALFAQVGLRGAKRFTRSDGAGILLEFEGVDRSSAAAAEESSA
jgi:hypothetical protein